jgi:hypothetical protein
VVVTADSELGNIKKLGAAAKLVAEDCGFEMRDFQIQPDLNGDLHAVTMVLIFDPEGQTKPKIEILQLEADVSSAMDDALAQRQQEARERAKRELSGLDLDNRQEVDPEIEEKIRKRRGGFL